MPILRQVAVIFACAIALTAADAPLAFELAEIHPSPRSINLYMRQPSFLGDRFSIRQATILNLIGLAWRRDFQHIVGGPRWVDLDRYDMNARITPGAKFDQVGPMLQTLLSERFGVKVHEGEQPMPVMNLSLGKGKPRLREASGEESRCDYRTEKGDGILTCRNNGMGQMAGWLTAYGASSFNRQIVDHTGLQGRFDYELRWTIPGAFAKEEEKITFRSAVENQLGLKLEPGTAPQKVLFIDSVNRNSGRNSPEAEKALPPMPPPEIDVASVRPTAPGMTTSQYRFNNGRIEVVNMPLKSLILRAWALGNSEGLLAGLPGAVEWTPYDIHATTTAARGASPDPDEMDAMLRPLLIERFHMKVHWDEREVEGYVLTAVKPHMEAADSANRANCREGPGPDGKDPRLANPVLSRLITCLNVTMAEFADRLSTTGWGYVRVPVVDATGLDGLYDFSLSFSPPFLLNGRGPRPADTASDPNGALSLAEAVSKQLGLKLELKKRPMKVLVIDHIDEKPSDN